MTSKGSIPTLNQYLWFTTTIEPNHFFCASYDALYSYIISLESIIKTLTNLESNGIEISHVYVKLGKS